MLISSYKSSLYSRLFIIAENKAIRNHFFTVLDSAANHNLHPAAIFRLSLYIITERTVISIHWQCYIRDTAIQFSVYKILLLHIGYGKRKCKLLPRAHNPQIEQKTQNKKRLIKRWVRLPGSVLSSLEPVQILSPLICLTSVFGMRTGVSTSLSPPDHFEVYPSKLNNSWQFLFVPSGTCD